MVAFDMNIITQKHRWVVLAQGCAHTHQPHDRARVAGFFVEFSQRSCFRALSWVDMALGQTPFSLVGSRGLLNEENFAILDNPGCHPKVT